jgi:hypothetical protein
MYIDISYIEMRIHVPYIDMHIDMLHIDTHIIDMPHIDMPGWCVYCCFASRLLLM